MHCSVLYCVSWCASRPHFQGVRSPQEWPSVVVLPPGSQMDRIPYGESLFYQDELILCQSYHGDYVYSCGGAAMSGDDGTTFSTQVLTVICTWAPVATSCCAQH
jgi:hypothetical protein